jgi:hypothetical protein
MTKEWIFSAAEKSSARRHPGADFRAQFVDQLEALLVSTCQKVQPLQAPGGRTVTLNSRSQPPDNGNQSIKENKNQKRHCNGG